MDVITTHTNTDFDAFASLVAARRLYPGAVAALPGSMNRNVREFFRLHADELEIADTGTVDHDAIERLIVVETVHAERLGEFEEVALRPGIELVVFDHHQPERPEWLPEENLVLSEDGALTTTLVGILAEREIEPTPLEATVFALGIHEDTGSLTYPAVTQRDADALGWCLRHGARQDMIAQYLHTPLGDAGAGALRGARLRDRDARRRRLRGARHRGRLARVRRRDLEPRPQADRPHRRARPRRARGDG